MGKTETDVKNYIKGLHDLSTIPVLLGKIVGTCNDENATAEDLYKLITFDPALAERVLRVSNSALLGHSGQVKDIHQAIMFLGFERIKSLALGMTVMNAFPSRGAITAVNLWVHSYEVAFLSSVLSDVIPLTLPGECFLAGLLHDVGRIVFFGMDNARFLFTDTTETMFDQEMAAFGCTHADAGAWLVESLGMPKELGVPIKYHHLPSAAKESRNLVAAVALAEGLTRKFTARAENDGIWTAEHDALLKQYSIAPEEITAIGEKLNEARPEIEAMFTSP
ncbi:MAG: HDOD domain-containing protein [Nitrospirae bacterium]|nr:HDOD domain-containing protein [Nitrospirota bacterium]NTW65655.1 HDOD domain-containing protein [Nitrospirota bacterium]